MILIMIVLTSHTQTGRLYSNVYYVLPRERLCHVLSVGERHADSQATDSTYTILLAVVRGYNLHEAVFRSYYGFTVQTSQTQRVGRRTKLQGTAVPVNTGINYPTVR